MNSGQWKPGQSGNTQGRGTAEAHKRRLARDLLEKHLEKAADVILNQLESATSTDKQWAAKMVLEYVCGKPGQALEVSGEGGGPLIAVIKDE